MSKASKSARAIKRKREKRGRKEANRARYAAMTAAGENKKSKRFQLRKKRAKGLTVNRNRQVKALSPERIRINELIAQARVRRQRERADELAAQRVRKAAKQAKNAAIWAACGRPLEAVAAA